jgi:hypothetical protein
MATSIVNTYPDTTTETMTTYNFDGTVIFKNQKTLPVITNNINDTYTFNTPKQSLPTIVECPGVTRIPRRATFANRGQPRALLF